VGLKLLDVNNSVGILANTNIISGRPAAFWAFEERTYVVILEFGGISTGHVELLDFNGR
jgi:hypothetical protein